jgi:hypothetical protein
MEIGSLADMKRVGFHEAAGSVYFAKLRAARFLPLSKPSLSVLAIGYWSLAIREAFFKLACFQITE